MFAEEYFAGFKTSNNEEAPHPDGAWANAWQPVWEGRDKRAERMNQHGNGSQPPDQAARSSKNGPNDAALMGCYNG